VRGLAKNSSFDVLKINLRLSLKEDDMSQGSGLFYVDTFDFYNARHRKSFLHAAAAECQLEADIIKRDLGRILLKLEELQEANINDILEPEKEAVQLSEEETKEALELLQSPKLIERIVQDFRLAGLVGEDTNALVSYLAATSRKTDDPLAVIIQSSSSAGKSAVMDAALAFMPDEELIRYTSMTGQSLFYMGETSLKHKILAISEEEGAEQAGYALKIF
jgi:DNA primase